MKLPSLPRLMLTHADFPEQDWAAWRRREVDESRDDDGATIDTSYLNVMPCCIHCATWICVGCYEFRRSRATRAVSQYCPRCGSREGFFVAIRHLKPHEPLTTVPFLVPRMNVIREGDPRYNLVQDLIEGDARRQARAEKQLRGEMKLPICVRPIQIKRDPTAWLSAEEARDWIARTIRRSAVDMTLKEAFLAHDEAFGGPLKAYSTACPAGDPCPATGCPACCPSYDPCGEEKCSFRCNPRRKMHVPEEAALTSELEEKEAAEETSEQEFLDGQKKCVHHCESDGMTYLECPVHNESDTPIADGPTYPHLDGDVIVLGPGIFVEANKEVISWGGKNYYRHDPEEPSQETPLAVEDHHQRRFMRREAMDWAVRMITASSPEEPSSARASAVIQTADEIYEWLNKAD